MGVCFPNPESCNSKMEFILYGQPGRPPGDGKTNVRKAAMRAFRRKERLERVQAFKEEKLSRQASKQRSLGGSPSATTPSPMTPEFLMESDARSTSNFVDNTSLLGTEDPNRLEMMLPEVPKDAELPIYHSNQDTSCLTYLFNYCMHSSSNCKILMLM